jgi:hypothetical protein
VLGEFLGGRKTRTAIIKRSPKNVCGGGSAKFSLPQKNIVDNRFVLD